MTGIPTGYNARGQRRIGRSVQTTEALKKVVLGNQAAGATTYFEGLLKTDLAVAPQFGQSTHAELQLWFNDGTHDTLNKVTPERTMTVYNFSTSLQVLAGVYCIIAPISGRWRIVYADCNDDAHPELL